MACDGGGNDEATMPMSEGDGSDDDIFPANLAEIVGSLPRGSHGLMYPSLFQYRGFWLPDAVLLDLPKVHASFDERPADVLLASLPKSGTTWLKALGFATARRSVHSPLDAAHPLLGSSSHTCVKFVEKLRFLEEDADCATDTTEPRPRLMSTHLPYSLLPRRARADGGGGCRIVYIARDPKDTLFSLWHFDAGVKWSQGEAAGTAAAALEFEEAFELYCQGQCGLGPQWEHVREYWEASKRRPGSVLFLRYEEMRQDPASNLKKMAEFMGCPFSAAEDAGVVRAILELCSLDKQRGLAVNKTGAYLYSGGYRIENRYFIIKGIVGDWRNHITLEMAARLDGIAEQARDQGLPLAMQRKATTPVIDGNMRRLYSIWSTTSVSSTLLAF